MRLAYVNTLFRQFHPRRAVQILLVEITRKLFDKYRISTYAQIGEDRIIDYYLSEISDGRPVFYVDIGCNRPIALSNTMRLYQMGARGFAVDANRSVIEEYRKTRPRDLCVCACVSDVCEDVEFVVAKDSARSGLAMEANTVGAPASGRSIIVQTVTLQELLDKHDVPRGFNVLSIDVEGHDLRVLRSFDIEYWRPKLIVIEMHGLDLGTKGVNENEVFRYLTEHGYRLASFAVMNGFFVRRD